MSDSSVDNPLLRQMRESGLPDEDIARADAMLGLLSIARKTRRRRGAAGGSRAIDAFFGFAFPRAHFSQSQIMQDLWVLFELAERRGGFFVEFGAANGVTMSNTHLLEKRFGWSGILAEPDPAFHARLARERTVPIAHVAISAETGQAAFLCAEKPAFSRLDTIAPDDVFEREGRRAARERRTVETLSLNDLLDRYRAPQRIDYISIDTEGAELDVLSTFDFSRHYVGLWTVEHNFTPERAGIHALLTAHGYHRRFPEFSRFDDWYVHRDLA